MGMALALMVGAAWFLARYQSMQRLGTPGVVVVSEPVYDPEGNRAGTNSVALPERVLDAESEAVPVARIVLDWLPPDTVYGQRQYQCADGFEMLVNVVLMGADRTSIHKPEYCLVGSGWVNHVYEPATLPVARPHSYDLPLMKVTTTRQIRLPSGQTEERRGIFVYWFVADDQLTARHGERMWWMARDLLWKRVLQRWAYVSAFSVCRPGREEETFERMRHLLAAMVPEFQITAGPRVERASAGSGLTGDEPGA